MKYFEGKLYYDPSKEPFEKKVKLYAEKYKDETGIEVVTCKVHPSMTELKSVNGTKIEETIVIPKNMFWVGREIETD